MSNKIQIKKSTLAKQVEDGMKKDALAEHYGVKVAEMTRILKQAGLKIRKFHVPSYEFVDDTNEEGNKVTEQVVEQAEELQETTEEVLETEAIAEEVVETQEAETVQEQAPVASSNDWGTR